MLVVAAACGGGDDDGGGASDTSSTTSTRPPKTTTAESTTTTTVLTQEEIVRREAVRLIGVRNDVRMHPDPNRVTEYVITLCECYQQELQGVTGLVNDGRHWAGPALEVVGAITREVEGNSAVVELILRQPDTDQVDANGNVVIEGTLIERIPVRLNVTRTTPGGDQWIITSWAFRDDWPEETVNEIIEAGVPE
ncbi:MAG: hypothetical protein ACRD0U_06210 [Acidimicrobiales bacterium]